MSVRFTGWTDLGQVTVTPNDVEIVIGSFSLEEGDNTLWVEMKSLSSPSPWPWSYAILGFKTSQGYELGSVKSYSENSGEVFAIGNGLQPVERAGVITLKPRSFNLAWVRQGNPWTLSFKAQSGVTGGSPSPPGDDWRTLGTFVNSTNGNTLPLFRVNFSGQE